MAASRTDPSTRRLSEVARHVVMPSGITETGWWKVRDTCRSKLGVTFDGWQDGIGQLILGECADGTLAATVGGVGMSLPRQIGKTFLLSGLIFGLCVNTPGLLVIWTSHHMKTSSETFLSMQAFADRPKVKPYVAKVFLGSGDEEIRFCNGSRILFGARERGFGRGIPGVDALIMDEAQILSERALQNMLATLNVSKLGLHVYCGTPPKPDDDSEIFTRMRDEALSGDATDVVWIECSADENADLDDRRQWAKANASCPHRTSLDAIKRLRRRLDPDGFRREGLGIWPLPDQAAFSLTQWAGLQDKDVSAPDRVALVVDVSPDRRWASIGAAGEIDGGRTVVMCYFGSAPDEPRCSGTDWVVPKVADLVDRGVVDEVAITSGQARALEPELTQLGVEYKRLSGVEMNAAFAAFRQAVKAGTVTHVGQRELDAAVANVRTRRLSSGETEAVDRREIKVDVSPLVACAGALYKWGLRPATYNILESVY